MTSFYSKHIFLHPHLFLDFTLLLFLILSETRLSLSILPLRLSVMEALFSLTAPHWCSVHSWLSFVPIWFPVLHVFSFKVRAIPLSFSAHVFAAVRISWLPSHFLIFTRWTSGCPSLLQVLLLSRGNSVPISWTFTPSLQALSPQPINTLESPPHFVKLKQIMKCFPSPANSQYKRSPRFFILKSPLHPKCYYSLRVYLRSSIAAFVWNIITNQHRLFASMPVMYFWLSAGHLPLNVLPTPEVHGARTQAIGLVSMSSWHFTVSSERYRSWSSLWLL